MAQKDEYGVPISITIPVYFSLSGKNILYDNEEMIKTLEDKIDNLPQFITTKRSKTCQQKEQ